MCANVRHCFRHVKLLSKVSSRDIESTVTRAQHWENARRIQEGGDFTAEEVDRREFAFKQLSNAPQKQHRRQRLQTLGFDSVEDLQRPVTGMSLNA